FAAPKKNGRPVYARLTWPVVWVTGIREKGQEQEQERILELAGDWEPTAIVWVPTVYPESARLSGLEGTTVLVIRITGQGDVDSAIVAQGSGDDSLDAAALRAALETEFSPRREKGQPVSRWAKYPVIFRLPPAGSPQDESSWPEADSVYLASANKMPGIRYMPPRPAGVGNSGGYPVTVIAFFVDQRGYVDPYRTAIAASSGYPELDSTALEWAWKCRFYPASNMGEPVAVKMTVPVKWTGDGSDERAYSPPSVPPVKTPAREEVTGQPPPTEAEQEQPPVPEQASVEEASEEKDRERASMPETMPELEGRPPLPKMPPDIARARVDGTTRVAFLVGADGSVVPDQVEILQSSGYPELDSLAAGWVRQLKFKPATGGGEPVAARISMPVHWKSGR
ncbi:MAG: energy transducer TonB, partial [Gemmatimonadota bacterium]|nr:energy transducer TonB [Gemmatimonadota bacterium]